MTSINLNNLVHLAFWSSDLRLRILQVLVCFAAVTSFVIFSAPSSAQSVVFRPSETFKAFKDKNIDGTLFYINGRTVHWNGPQPDGMVTGLEKMVMSLAVLKLHDEVRIDLASRLSVQDGMPHPVGPYSDLPTIKDVLTESAGFATPPSQGLPTKPASQLSSDLFSRFMISLRVPDKVSSHDPVGWAYLVRLIENNTGENIETALQTLVFEPLGITAEDRNIQQQSLLGKQMPLVIGLTPEALTKILVGIVRNRDAQNKMVLYTDTYEAFVANITDPNTLLSMGLSPIMRAGITVLTDRCETGGVKLAFVPKADTLFGKIGRASDAEPCQAFHRAAADIAANTLPPSAENAHTSLRPSSNLSGTYVWLNATPAWLADRLSAQSFVRRDVRKSSNGYDVLEADASIRSYTQDKPYILSPTKAQPPAGGQLYFSPYRNGGYMRHDGVIYRKVGSLVHVGKMSSYLPLALILLLTAAVYALKPVSTVSRNMGRVTFIGVTLLSLGLYLDLTFWPHVVYGLDMPILATLWRTGLNIGIMLCLSLPFYAYSATRTLQGALTPLFRLHMLAVAGSALFILLTLTMLGITGQFSAY